MRGMLDGTGDARSLASDVTNGPRLASHCEFWLLYRSVLFWGMHLSMSARDSPPKVSMNGQVTSGETSDR